MSVATERREAKGVLATHSLMKTPEIAEFLNVDVTTVRELLKGGRIPSVNIGSQERHVYAADPMDVVVFILAEKEDRTVASYWLEYGNDAADHAREYLERVRRFDR